MRMLRAALVLFVAVAASAAQSADTLLSDTRLTVHTLVREDVFGGFLGNDLVRVARAETNIESLMKSRPDQRANLLAWRSAAAMTRAVAAHEAGNAQEFAKYFATSREGFAEAAKLSSGNDGVPPITGGTMAVFADRLPAEHRAAAWAQAYDSYSLLWKQQGAGIENMPVHFKGEVLAGMAQSAQRTGRNEESAQFIDRMLTVLANTPYEATAKQWKADPASAATTNLTCKNCHNPGRLSNRLAALNKGAE
jgi:hypothetical protein